MCVCVHACVVVCVQAVSGSLALISAKFPLHRMHPQFCFPQHVPAISFGDYRPCTCCSHAFTMQSHAPMTTSILAGMHSLSIPVWGMCSMCILVQLVINLVVPAWAQVQVGKHFELGRQCDNGCHQVWQELQTVSQFLSYISITFLMSHRMKVRWSSS